MIVADLLHADMALPSEALPHGASFDWAKAPRVNPMGWAPETMSALIPWGQLYETADGNPQPGAKAQIRDLACWTLSKTGDWTRTHSVVHVEGAAYVEDYGANASLPADTSLSNGATVAQAGAGRNFHFWAPDGRKTIRPADLAGVMVTCRARLHPGSYDPAQPVGYVMSVGADWWASKTATWLPDWSANRDVGIGRFKRVEPGWRLFTMTTTGAAVPCPTVASTAEQR